MESVTREWIGIDISKSWFDVFGFGESSRFENSLSGFDLFLSWLREREVFVILESTGGHERALRSFCDAHEIPVSVADSVRVKAFGVACGRIHKTDKADAKLLWFYASQMRPGFRTLDRHSIQELRRLVACWNDLRSERLSLSARLRSPGLPEVARKGIDEAVSALQSAIDEVWSSILSLIESDYELSEGAKLLQSIPGIGQSASVQVLANLPEGFLRTARGLARYAGLVPAQRESGSSIRGRSRIVHRCNSNLRSLLYMCSLSASRFCPSLKVFYTSLIARGKAKKQALVAVARKLAHAIYGVLKTKTKYDGGKLIQKPLTR